MLLIALHVTESVHCTVIENKTKNFGLCLTLHFIIMLFCDMQRRLAKEARAQELQAKNAALGKKVKEPSATKAAKGRGEASFYRVTCKV